MDSGEHGLGFRNREEAATMGLVSRRCGAATNAGFHCIKEKMGSRADVRLGYVVTADCRKITSIC